MRSAGILGALFIQSTHTDTERRNTTLTECRAADTLHARKGIMIIILLFVVP